MAFLIDKNSPITSIRSGISPKLRHRSRQTSESENSAPEASVPGMLHNKDEFSYEKDGEQTNCEPAEDPDIAALYGSSERHHARSKSMLGYFMTELTRDYKLEGDASEFVERRDRVYTSVNTPKNLEKFCAFGFLQCLDSILYMVTFLPLRILVAIMRVLTYPCAVLFMGSRRVLDGAQTCDLLKGVILVASCFITSYMDMSMIYHIVRGQSIIKFYVFYNMLDVMDKLVSGFGQDVLDSLYWTAVEPRGRKREHFGTVFHLIFAIVYVVIHTVMILIQAIILNVAFNSHNKNLLTIMMSNNFVEIKGNLFKRLDKNNLCQITYSDIKERFHYLVLLLFVFIRNMKEMQWSWDVAFPIIQDAVIVMLVEVVVDWIKHAFITKFNELSASSYGDFALGLAQDIASSQKKHAFTNFSDQVCRRMGFTPMPLICLLFMVCSKSFNFDSPLPWLLVFLFYLCLISTKILNSIILLGWAQRLINERDKTTKHTGTVVNSQVIPKKEAPKPKHDTIPEVPVISARVTPVSSNAAVNTDSTLFMKADSLVSMAQPGGEPILSTLGNGKSHHVEDYVIPQEVAVSLSYIDGDTKVSQKNDVSIHQVGDGFGQSLSNVPVQQSSSLYSVSPIASEVSVKQSSAMKQVEDIVESYTSEALKPAIMDFQTDFLSSPQTTSSSSSHKYTSATVSEAARVSPHIFRSTSSPVKLSGSPKRKHPDSTDSSCDSFFNLIDKDSMHIDNSSLPEQSTKPLREGQGASSESSLKMDQEELTVQQGPLRSRSENIVESIRSVATVDDSTQDFNRDVRFHLSNSSNSLPTSLVGSRENVDRGADNNSS